MGEWDGPSLIGGDFNLIRDFFLNRGAVSSFPCTVHRNTVGTGFRTRVASALVVLLDQMSYATWPTRTMITLTFTDDNVIFVII
jgi:hypothetical protein